MLKEYNLNHYQREPSNDEFTNWLYENSVADAPEPNVEMAWNKLSQNVSTKNSKKLGYAYYMKVAAVVTLLVVSVIVLKDYFDTPEMIEIAARDGQESIVLPDGSKVILGEKSELHYAEEFGDVRSVSFTGQAYFEVTKDSKPFIITMNGGEVEVLGTAFDLVSNTSEILVTLDHGKVALSGVDNSVEISTGESVKLGKSTQLISKLDTAPANYNSWRTGEFTFNDTPLLEVVRDLEKHYNVGFKVSKRVANCKVTANFKNLTVDEVCEALEAILSVKVNQKGTSVTIRGKGCE